MLFQLLDYQLVEKCQVPTPAGQTETSAIYEIRRPSGRPKGEGEALRGNPFPCAPGGSRVAAGVKEAKPLLLNTPNLEPIGGYEEG